MKKYVTISLFIFWAIVTAVLAAGLVFYQNRTSNNNLSGKAPDQLAANESGLTLNMAEIARHNQPNNCWLLISNKVYNVTDYISGHPGGAGSILQYCGQDATIAYDTKDRNRPHSAAADNLLVNYYIGDLNQVLSSQSKSNVTPAANPVASSDAIKTATDNSTAGKANPLLLNQAEISKHNTAGNCWLIISNKVYNVSNYLASHPGGVGTISPYCGQEATQAFQTKDRNSSHSSSANNLLASYYIGDLNQATNQQQIDTVIQQTNIVQPPVGRGNNEEEFEDD